MTAENYTKLLMLLAALVAVLAIMFYNTEIPFDTRYKTGDRFSIIHREKVENYGITIIKDKNSGAEYMIIGESNKPGVVKL